MSSKKAILALRNLLDGHEAIWSNPQAIPEHKRLDIDQRILLEAQPQVKQELQSIAIAAAHSGHRRRTHEFLQFLSGLTKQAINASQTGDAAEHLLAEAVTQSAHKHAREELDAVVLLGGPAASTVAPMLCDKLQVTPDELPGRIMALLLASMKDIAKSSYGIDLEPQPGPLFNLLTPEEVLAAFHALIDTHLYENNFYSEVRKLGVETFTSELYQQAEPRIHFARQSPALGLDFFQDSIATFPVPTGPEDQQTLNELRQALPDVKIRLVRSQPDSCRLTRRLAGFPFCALAANASLSKSYAASSKYDHLPHTPGILPGVTDGRAMKAMVDYYSSNNSKE